MSEIPGQSGHALPDSELPVCARSGPSVPVCWCRRHGRMDMGGERKTLRLTGRVGAIVAGRDQIFPNAAKPDMAERLEKHLSRRFSNPSSTAYLELFR